MKRFLSLTLLIAVITSMLTVGAQATDYTFETDGTPEYYGPTAYEDTYGAQYNFGGKNLVDYQTPALEYGTFSTTQAGVMEKAAPPGLQQNVASATGGGNYGVGGTGGNALSPDSSTGITAPVLPPVTAFTKLTDSFLLSNGAVGRISIPAIGIRNYYVWEGATTSSMKKGVAHFSDTSVWDGNVGICGHNRGAAYVIGDIKKLEPGDEITYKTSLGSRTYEVETVTTISNSNWSYLQATTDNRITLITCVAGDSSRRWCVQAVEVR